MSTKQTSTTFGMQHKFAFRLMHLIFVSVPLLAGIDKFFNFITIWENYVSPTLKPAIPMSAKNIMRCAGVVEIAVGTVTLVKPRVGSTAFVLMLFGIIINLMTMKKQLHIASLDLCLGCFALVFALLLPQAEKAH